MAIGDGLHCEVSYQVEVPVLEGVVLDQIRNFQVSLLSLKYKVNFAKIIALIDGYINDVLPERKHEPTVPFRDKVNLNDLIRLLINELVLRNVNLLEQWANP